MHGTRSPCHASARQKIGRKSLRNIDSAQVRNGNLYRLVGETGRSARALKINGSERDLSDLQAKSRSVDSQSKQASVMETPYCKVERSTASGWLPAWIWLSIIAPMISRLPDAR